MTIDDKIRKMVLQIMIENDHNTQEYKNAKQILDYLDNKQENDYNPYNYMPYLPTIVDDYSSCRYCYKYKYLQGHPWWGTVHPCSGCPHYYTHHVKYQYTTSDDTKITF